MKKLITTLVLCLTLISCRSKTSHSGLESATFAAGDSTYFVYYARPAFHIHKCKTTSELTRILNEEKDLSKAKSLCRDTIAIAGIQLMVDAIQKQISNVAPDEMIAAKSSRLTAIQLAVDDLDKSANAVAEEISILYAGISNDDPRKKSAMTTKEKIDTELASLTSERERLQVAIGQAKISSSMSPLMDLDVRETLGLAGEIEKTATDYAQALARLLASDVIYHLDSNRNQILIKAVQGLDTVCTSQSRNGREAEADLGLERFQYVCQKDGSLSVSAVSCPLPGYERKDDFCLFTGKGLNVSNIAASHNGVCAVTRAKAITCWGKAGSFPVQSGSSRLGLPMAQMMGESVIGSDHSMCSLDSSKKLNRCWTKVSDAPLNQDVFTSVQGGFSHYCGLTSEGSIKCWGENDFGQTQVPKGLTQVKNLSVGEQSSCVINGNNEVACWGTHRGARAQSGPAAVPLKAIAISSGPTHACAILEDKTVSCWGQNESGQIDVPGDLGPVRQVVAARYETCVITQENTLRCWGGNPLAQAYKPAPSIAGVSRIITGDLSANLCVLTLSGKANCWGSLHSSSDYDVEVPEFSAPVEDLAITAVGYICARLSNGSIQCFGNLAEATNEVPAIFAN